MPGLIYCHNRLAPRLDPYFTSNHGSLGAIPLQLSDELREQSNTLLVSAEHHNIEPSA
jgi:hypothetical protein